MAIRTNVRLIGSHSDDDSSVGMPNLAQGDEEQNSDEDSSVGIPELIDRHDDSNEEDTVEFSVGSSYVASDAESVTTVDEDINVEEGSIGTSGSSVIRIENLEAVVGEAPERYTTCFTCEVYDHGGHTYGACANIRPRETLVQPRQYRVVMANELRRLGIEPLADLHEQSDQVSAEEEEPELGLGSQQSFPTSNFSLLRDPHIYFHW